MSSSSPPYTCYRCMKPFNQKIHLINHLKRKKNCPPHNEEAANISTESLLNDLSCCSHKKHASAGAGAAPGPEEEREREGEGEEKRAPAMITNSGGINFFIFPGLNAAGLAEPGETKILSSVNFSDIGTAINSLLGFIVNNKQPQDISLNLP